MPSVARRWLSRVALVAVAGLVAALGVPTSSEAAATEDGWIEGSIRDEDGNYLPVAHFSIAPVDLDTAEAGEQQVSGTDSLGRFRVRVAPGSYILWTGLNSRGYSHEFWRDRSYYTYGKHLDPRDLPELIHVEAGQTVTGIDVVVGRGGAISGRVAFAGPSPTAAEFADTWIELIVFDPARRVWSRTGSRIHPRSDGTFSYGSTPDDLLLQPGRYRLVVEYSGDRGHATVYSGDIVVRTGVASPFSATLKPTGGWYPELVDTVYVETESITTSGIAPIGELWSAYPGIWRKPDGTRFFAFTSTAWLRCDHKIRYPSVTIPAGCVVIRGATGTTYRTTEADAGRYISFWVRVANDAGLARSLVALTHVRTASLVSPSMTRSPGLTGGGTAVGSSWTLDPGEWAGTATPRVTQAWLRCSGPVLVATSAVPRGCVAIPGARGLTYVTTTADAGKYITAQVAARNGAGVLRTLVPTAAALDPLRAPSSSAPASLTGSGVGTTWSVNPGTWTGNPAPTVTQAWLRCTSPVRVPAATVPRECVAIPGARGVTYVPGSADVGRYLVVQIAARNTRGTVRDVVSSSEPVG